MRKKLNIIKRYKAWLPSKAGLLTNGIIAGVLTLFAIFCFAFPLYIVNNGGAFASPEVIAARQDTIVNGVPFTDITPNRVLFGSSFNEKTKIIEGQEYEYIVALDSAASDYFSLEFTTEGELGGVPVTIDTSFSEILLVSSVETFKDAIPVVRVAVKYEEPTQTLFGENTEASVEFCVKADLSLVVSDEHSVHIGDPMVPGEYMSDVYERANAFATKLPALLREFGITDIPAFVKGCNAVFEIKALAVAFTLLNIISSALMVLFDSLFFGCLVFKIAKKREKSEQEAPLKAQIEEKPAGPVDELPPRPTSKTAEWLAKKHIRPVLGEWFFRGLGLGLVALATIFVIISARAGTGAWGPGWEKFALGGEDFFTAISSAGQLILVIAVVSIISETRFALNFSAWGFMTLAFLYYFFMCAVLFAIRTVFGNQGFVIAEIMSASLPGNIFFGIGLYAIIGFFLFFDAPKEFINRKVFRSLASIPTLLAIASIVCTALFRGGIYNPSFWIRNAFFIRDAAIVGIGIIYEYVLFIFRTIYKRQYKGQDVDEVMERPIIQFQKNLSLSILIIIYSVIFYLIPKDVRSNLGTEGNYTIFFLFIPLVLFYKPAGRHHKQTSDLVYYVLFFIIWALPSIARILSGGSFA